VRGDNAAAVQQLMIALYDWISVVPEHAQCLCCHTPHLTQQMPCCGAVGCFAGVPSPKALLQYASSIAHTLNLACPPLSPALWLDKLIAELQLPQVSSPAFGGVVCSLA
jgi:hypothetical protein